MAKAAFPEEAVSDDLMNIKFIQNRICVLIDRRDQRDDDDSSPRKQTLLKLAVKTTTS